MKKFASIVAAVVVLAPSAIAQKNKVVTAYNYEKSYRERGQKCIDLQKAKIAIEQAKNDATTKTWAKTWYYRGNIYFNMLASKDPACKNLSKNPLDACYESYMKAIMLNFKDPALQKIDLESGKQEEVIKFVKALSDKNTQYSDPAYNADILGRRFPGISGEYVNKGVEHFQTTKDYPKAVENFEKAMSISGLTGRVDTTVMYYAALAADNAKDYKKASMYYGLLEKMNYGGTKDGPTLYLNHSRVLKADSMPEKSFAKLKEGREKYPADKNLLNREINHFVEKGMNQEAMQSLNQAIEKSPNNPVLHALVGSVYEGLKEKDKAVASYKKAIELDPKNFDANFNLGALYFNEGAEWNNKANEYGFKETAKIDEANKAAETAFMNATPYLEKANELNPEDVSVVKPLLKVYAMTGEEDKYSALKAKYK